MNVNEQYKDARTSDVSCFPAMYKCSKMTRRKLINFNVISNIIFNLAMKFYHSNFNTDMNNFLF